jgi:hypothetical protein
LNHQRTTSKAVFPAKNSREQHFGQLLYGKIISFSPVEDKPQILVCSGTHPDGQQKHKKPLLSRGLCTIPDFFGL